ncbi:MAG: type II secretion system secretin GspD [Pseudomonadota bacterium]
MQQERHFRTTVTKRRLPHARVWACSALAASLSCGVLPAQAQNEEGGRAAIPSHQVSRARAPVTLNFVNADIEAVTRAMSAMLDRPIMVDPRVRGQITVYSEQPLSIREAYLNYLAALRGLGFTVVENAGLLKVVPEADAKLQAGTVSVGTPSLRGDQIITQVFRLNYENANNLVTILRPLISPNNTINANPGNNTLVITDYADNLQRISRIIAAIDTPSGTDVDIVPLQHAVAADLAPLVQRLSEGGSTGVALPPGVPGAGGAGAITVIPDSRSNSLILRAANPARLASMRAVIEKLDRPMGSAGPAGNIYVVYLRNADAVKLATVLRAAFTAGSNGGGAGGLGGGSGITPTQPSPSANVTSLGGSAGGGTSSTAATAPLAASASPSTGGFVQADPATNSLIITAPEPLYRQIRAVIDQLDSRRAQIYVEAVIVELNDNENSQLGVQWLLLGGPDGKSVSGGVGTAFGTSMDNILGLAQALTSGATGTTPFTPEGFVAAGVNRFGANGRYGLGVLAKAFAGVSGANVLSAPNLVTLDNEEAKIVVGDNVPFITGSFTNTGTGSGATNPFQTIERKDVGLVLRVRPQVGEGNTVRMTIFQESSNVLNETAAGTANAGPSTTKRSIESTVVVDDGNVIVIGGLIQDRYNDNRSKVPLLGDIPVLGALFRTESRERRRTNLMVFLRPVVLRDQAAANAMSSDRYDFVRNQQLGTKPETRATLPISGVPVLPDTGTVQQGRPLMAPAASAPSASAPASAPSAPTPQQ